MDIDRSLGHEVYLKFPHQANFVAE